MKNKIFNKFNIEYKFIIFSLLCFVLIIKLYMLI